MSPKRHSDNCKNDLDAEQSHRAKPIHIHEDNLILIFELLARDVPDPDSAWTYLTKWNWVCVTEVCRYWRTIATGTPTLWSHIHTFYSAYRTQKSLLLSKNSDLMVQYTEHQETHGEVTLCNLKTVLKEMQRICYLYIDIYRDLYRPDLNDIYRLLEQAAPRMKSLTLKLPSNADKPRFQLPNSESHLESIKLCNIDLLRNVFRISGLSILSIQKCENLSLSELLGVLESSPELKMLTIDTCDVENSLIPRVAHLSHLLDLTLDMRQSSVCLNFIRCLDTPNLLRWEVRCGENLVLDEVAKIDALSNLSVKEYNTKSIDLSTRCVEGAHSIKLKIHGERSKTNQAKADLRLSFDRVDLNVVISYLIKIFRKQLNKAEYLMMNRPDNSITVETWYNFFCTLVTARSINVEVGHGNHHGRNLFKALARVDRSTHPLGLVPCPNLHRVHIKWFGTDAELNIFMFTLENMLMKRLAHRLAVDDLHIDSNHGIRDEKKMKRLARYVQKIRWK